MIVPRITDSLASRFAVTIYLPQTPLHLIILITYHNYCRCDVRYILTCSWIFHFHGDTHSRDFLSITDSRMHFITLVGTGYLKAAVTTDISSRFGVVRWRSGMVAVPVTNRISTTNVLRCGRTTCQSLAKELSTEREASIQRESHCWGIIGEHLISTHFTRGFIKLEVIGVCTGLESKWLNDAVRPEARVAGRRCLEDGTNE